MKTYFFLAAVVAAGAPPFDALGTRTVPFLTAGALVPPTDMPPTFDVGGRPLAAAVYLFMFQCLFPGKYFLKNFKFFAFFKRL